MEYFTGVKLRDDDIYIVGNIIGDDKDPSEDKDLPWSLDGIFFNLESARSVMIEDQFVSRFPVMIMLPHERQYALQNWWMIEGELVKSPEFIDG